MNRFLSSENDEQINKENKDIKQDAIKTEDKNIIQENTIVNENKNDNNITTNTKEAVNNTSTNKVVTNDVAVTSNTNTNQVQVTPSPAPPVEQTGIKINLVRASGTVSIALEDYVVGVVGAEMPASFSPEALKAQAVVARTYALKRVAENKTITDTNTNQIYKDNNQLKAIWGSSYDTYYNKIKNAVESTKKEYVAYNGYYIDALYHSTSNGKTEDPINVWGGSFPYLKSVDSHWDVSASSYERTQNVSAETFSSTLGIPFTVDTPIEILSKTIGDRINQIKIGDNIYRGIDIRDLFGLRSADFDVTVSGDTIIFTTRGYGHGVGMSQYGANGMAKEGYGYRDILSHYYPNTNIKTID
jgi:stage II sporulation protein D